MSKLRCRCIFWNEIDGCTCRGVLDAVRRADDPGEPLQGDVLAPNTAWTYSWQPYATSPVWVIGGF